GARSLDMTLVIKVLGVILVAAGLVLAINPDFLLKSPAPVDAYQLIEKRVKWGFLIGFGILLIIHHQFTPWSFTASALLFSLTLGIVLARFLGIVLDGAFAKQFLWLGIELFILAGFGFWYWKQSI